MSLMQCLEVNCIRSVHLYPCMLDFMAVCKLQSWSVQVTDEDPIQYVYLLVEALQYDIWWASDPVRGLVSYKTSCFRLSFQRKKRRYCDTNGAGPLPYWHHRGLCENALSHWSALPGFILPCRSATLTFMIIFFKGQTVV